MVLFYPTLFPYTIDMPISWVDLLLTIYILIIYAVLEPISGSSLILGTLTFELNVMVNSDYIIMFVVCVLGKHDGGVVLVTLPDHVLHLDEDVVFVEHFVVLELGHFDVLLVEVGGELDFVDGGGHDDEFGVLEAVDDLPDQAEQEVDVLGAFVHFVDDDVRVPGQVVVVHDGVQQHSRRHELDFGVVRGHFLVLHLLPH